MKSLVKVILGLASAVVIEGNGMASYDDANILNSAAYGALKYEKEEKVKLEEVLDDKELKLAVGLNSFSDKSDSEIKSGFEQLKAKWDAENAKRESEMTAKLEKMQADWDAEFQKHSNDIKSKLEALTNRESTTMKKLRLYRESIENCRDNGIELSDEQIIERLNAIVSNP